MKNDKNKFEIGEKYQYFVNSPYKVEILEGTTCSGKTTVAAGVKFILKVMQSNRKLHVLAGRDLGVVEKNIISAELGILELWGGIAEYRGSGSLNYKIPHIVVHAKNEDKIILICNYNNISSWKKVLGGQYGCVFLDEANISDLEFLDEISARWSDWLCFTLNPDNPDLPIYNRYINHSRPVKKYENDIPPEVLKYLVEKEKKGWKYWFFSFKDNIGLTEERIEQIKNSVPEGTKMYNNKVLGLRSRAEGLVFSNFSCIKNTISKKKLDKLIKEGKIKWKYLLSGMDTSYSQKTEDTIAFTLCGISDNGVLYYLKEEVLTNKNNKIPFAPSDISKKYVKFLEKCEEEYNKNIAGCFVDCADQATITELYKYKREHFCRYNFNNSYKKIKIIDRINLVLGWIKTGSYIVVNNCTEHLKEINTYSWQNNFKNGEDIPEDSNDHTINSSQYAWIPYRNFIGNNIN